MDFPIENGDFPYSYVSLPNGTWPAGPAGTIWSISWLLITFTLSSEQHDWIHFDFFSDFFLEWKKKRGLNYFEVLAQSLSQSHQTPRFRWDLAETCRKHPLCHQILVVEARSVVGSFLISADFLWIHFPFCGEVFFSWEDRWFSQKALVLPDKGLDNLGFPIAWDNPDEGELSANVPLHPLLQPTSRRAGPFVSSFGTTPRARRSDTVGFLNLVGIVGRSKSKPYPISTFLSFWTTIIPYDPHQSPC